MFTLESNAPTKRTRVQLVKLPAQPQPAVTSKSTMQPKTLVRNKKIAAPATTKKTLVAATTPHQKQSITKLLPFQYKQQPTQAPISVPISAPAATISSAAFTINSAAEERLNILMLSDIAEARMRENARLKIAETEIAEAQEHAKQKLLRTQAITRLEEEGSKTSRFFLPIISV